MVETVLAREIDVLLSETVFTELVSRLDRPKFDRYREPDAWNLFLFELVELAAWHENTGAATGISRDADEDKFLALAAAGGADAIVSGDSDLLDLGHYADIPILTPAQCLRWLGNG